MEYTIASTDENHYNRIRVNLPLPSWKYSNVMITSCVCNCNILVIKKGDLGVRIVIDPDTAALTYHPIKLFPTQSNLKAVSFYYLNNDSDIILCKKVVMRKEGEEWKIFAVHYFSHSGTIDTLRGENLCKDTLKVSNLLYDEAV